MYITANFGKKEKISAEYIRIYGCVEKRILNICVILILNAGASGDTQSIQKPNEAVFENTFVVARRDASANAVDSNLDRGVTTMAAIRPKKTLASFDPAVPSRYLSSRAGRYRKKGASSTSWLSNWRFPCVSKKGFFFIISNNQPALVGWSPFHRKRHLVF